LQSIAKYFTYFHQKILLTPLWAVTGSAKIKALGYWHVLSPVLTGALILFIIALFF
jgi:CBS-domain-containing membrane protein